MITLACLECRLALMINGEHDEVDYLIGMKSDWYPDRYPCPRSGCKGTMTLTDTIASTDLQNLEVHHLNPQEAFQALHGMGLPEERRCNESMVELTLVGQTIKSVELQNLNGSNRTILHSFTLDSGIRVYIGSSPFGALVYRMAPPSSAVQRLTEEQAQ
jgi:hypothetical protein